MNKTVSCCVKIAAITLSVSSVHANKPIYPAEIAGRDLNYVGLGWLGHIGVTAANKISQNSDWILMIADIPMPQETPQHIAAEMRFANDTHLNDIKRGIFIDRVAISGKEPDTVKNLIKLYNETESESIKEKVIQGMMIYYQQHLDLTKNTNDQMLLKSFFAKLLDEKFVNQTASQVVRGFVDLHSYLEIQDNLTNINRLLIKMPHQSSIMLKMLLASQSKELEKIYIKSIVLELRQANNSDLDNFLFGPLSMAYKNTGPNVLAPESRKEVIEYLKFVAHKYTDSALLDNKNDKYAAFTAPTYFELVKNIGM